MFYNLAGLKPATTKDGFLIPRLLWRIIKVMKLLALFMLLIAISFSREVPFTHERIEELQTLMLWGFGVLFSGMGILIGLVMWDRRTAISPVVR
jgi:uncharacterized protein YacL